ncbi:uncharacterized protein [Penaeus vannamei]|uniref:uncharacterized protein isoform X4 n=2 Tax=Penaeus vannamei TaxID=6689 RepID=UPI00387F7849
MGERGLPTVRWWGVSPDTVWVVMRGESGEAIVGAGVGDEGMLSRQSSGGVKSPASPPLSAAASQVSLAPSDLTTSDPDIAGSSAYSSAPSSRPPSSSQVSLAPSDLHSSDLDLTATSSPTSSRPPSSSGIATPDLTLPAPEDYTAETVEFPTSPLAMKTVGLKSNGVCLVDSEDSGTGTRSMSNFLSPDYKPDELESCENSPRQGDGFEVSSDLEEDYFEEFHLPNSHENAFVRHKSFRRKVNLTPINAPDAEKIEGLVRAGEFQRHGSMRRKIVPAETTIQEHVDNEKSALDSNENLKEAGANVTLNSEVGTFAKDLQEIENLLNDCEVGEDISDIVLDSSAGNDLRKELEESDRSTLQQGKIQHTNTSTPKTNSTRSTSTYAATDLSLSLTEESREDESLSIEQSTLMKVRECLDFTKYRDMYNLSGRLQDILTPKEVEEILNNSERYSEYVDKEVIEALHNSLQEQISSHNTRNTMDSGISSPKKTVITTEGLDLGNTVKKDIRAVFDDSSPVVHENDSNSSKRSSDIFIDDIDFDDSDDTGFRFERRRSLRLSKEGHEELEVEGVFVESKSQDLGMKKIPAPVLDLSGATSEDLNDVPDLSNSEILTPQRHPDLPGMSETRVPNGVAQNKPLEVPDIVITGTCDPIETQNESTEKLLVEGSDLSDVTTPSLVNTPSVVNTPSTTFEYMTPDEERPSVLDFGNISQRKRISVAEDILRSPVEDDNISVASAFSQRSDGEDEDGFGDEDLDIYQTPKGNLGAPSESTQHLEPIPTPPPQLLIPEFSASEESAEERHWRSVVIGGVWRRIDMKVIAPYRKCVSHGGYLGGDQNAVIVISACQLPDRSRRDYNYVMDNLFLYVLSTLEQLIADDYVLVYLAGGTPKSHMPNFHWLKRAYQMIDRKLRKNLKALHVVHPTFWVRTVVAFSRPFISTKFYRKLTFVNNLTELAQVVPLDQLEIPDAVKQADFELMIREKKKNLNKSRTPSLVAR